MSPSPEELKRDLRQRVAEEELADFRVKELERWILRLPDDQVANAVELFLIGLDAPRRARWAVLRIIDEELRRPNALIPHPERVTLLRWLVRSRPTDARVRAKLEELHATPSAVERTRIIDHLAEGDIGSIANAHDALAIAWRAAPPEARPHGDAHRGEPEPVIGSRNGGRLAIWLARRLEHLVPKREKKAWKKLLRLAEDAVASGHVTPALMAATEEAPAEGASSLARLACVEARVAGVAVRGAATRAVALLLEAEGTESVRRLLLDLDEEIRRLDVLYAIERRGLLPKRRILGAIHRASDPESKTDVVFWLAALEGGSLGLLAEEGRLWTWTEGHRDDILAMIPDAHFETAVMALGRDA